ncbi:hypothetical protein DRH14_02365 [Candidatus Shapirobacteria bacterium]|nr:MAG: hypothetical protein DRH14_02365 [Candidatus Shapirobacteria bacterium]
MPNSEHSKDSPFQVWSWLFKLLFKLVPTLLSTLFLVNILSSLLPFARSYTFSRLIDSVSSFSLHPYPLYTAFFYLVFIRLFTSLNSRVKTMLYQVMSTKLRHELNKLYLKTVSSLDFQHFDSRQSANLITKVSEEYRWRINEVLFGVLRIFNQFISLLAIIIILLPHYPLAVFILFVSQIPSYFINRKWQKIDWQYFNNHVEKNRIGWDSAWQLTSKKYMSELKISQATSFLFNHFRKVFDPFIDGQIRIKQQKNFAQLPLILVYNLSIATAVLFLVKDTSLGIISVGMFTFYYNSIRQTRKHLSGILGDIVSISEQLPYIQDFKNIFQLEKIIKSGSKKVNSRVAPKIEFKNVNFKYPNSHNYIFKNLNLTINSQEEVAIVGTNGAGKSTLIKLICRFYDPQQGQILINGVDIKKLNLNNWRRQLSVLFQEFNTYGNLSLKDNIIISQSKQVFNKNKVISALKKSEAYSFTKKYSQFLDTVMSHRYGGQEPSWGQWQKIAIARIFYANSSLLILDEPTASIDAVSEHKIFDHIYQQTRGKTLVIVSHRFSTVRNAQRIIVLDKGRVLEEGSHKRLLAKNGFYAKSFRLQARGYK